MPKSAVHKFVLNGRAPKGEKEEQLFNTLPSHSLILESAYREVMQSEPEFTNFTDTFCATLDYIFYSKNDFSPVEVLSFPEKSLILKTKALPNISLPSDHLSIATKLVFKTK